MTKPITVSSWIGGVAALAVAAALGAGATLALASGEPSKPYAGQEGRDIKSLSAEDIAQLLDGAGWGFAKPAELSGYPGPAHVLELADQIQLSVSQRDRVQAAYDRMRADARRLGKAYVDGEAALTEAFSVSGQASAEKIARLVAANAELRGRLRLVHLNAHLEIWPVLSAHQRARYAALRGYGKGGEHPSGGHSAGGHSSGGHKH